MMLSGTSPLRDFMSLREAMDRLFEDSVVSPGNWLTWNSGGTRYLPLDVYETPDKIVVRALVPGVSPDGIDVQYQQGVLTLRAQYPQPEVKDGWRWHIREFGAGGETVRRVTLPIEVDIDHAETSFEHGVLTLTLPKAPEARPKQIKVSASPQLTGTASSS
ncbi:MAG TPA: Hsp20/alpha crystallin family protein [Candidatus Limnocylindria bacterium]|nr:Hsp20/alpha crystallin family protein [Candidatus Limnocylindria bacterium]